MSAKPIFLVFLALFSSPLFADAPSKLQPQIQALTNNCYQQWLTLDWKIGPQQTPAHQNPAFNNGIKRLCQARAELFLDGYQITPTIEPDSQEQVFPIVMQPSIDNIKQFLKQDLPPLKLI